MARVFGALLGVLTFLGPTLASDRHPLEEIAAAVALAETGVASQNASLILTALELLSSHPVMGQPIDDLRVKYTTEARFLIRGDVAHAARLNAIGPVTDPSGRFFRISDFTERLVLPEGHGLSALTVTADAIVNDLKTSDGNPCGKQARVWRCRASGARGVLLIEGHAARPAWIIFETVPIAP